jgi:hypothetical protein
LIWSWPDVADFMLYCQMPCFERRQKQEQFGSPHMIICLFFHGQRFYHVEGNIIKPFLCEIHEFEVLQLCVWIICSLSGCSTSPADFLSNSLLSMVFNNVSVGHFPRQHEFPGTMNIDCVWNRTSSLALKLSVGRLTLGGVCHHLGGRTTSLRCSLSKTLDALCKCKNEKTQGRIRLFDMKLHIDARSHSPRPDHPQCRFECQNLMCIYGDITVEK